MKYKLVIFDWDGTVLDSSAHIVDCFLKVSKEFNMPVHTPDEITHYIGLKAEVACENLYPTLDADTITQIVAAFRKYYIEGRGSCDLFPGVPETLATLKEAGFVLAVATGKSRQALDADLTDHKLDIYFSATRTAQETANKPDPKMVYELLAELNFSAQEAILIGDTTFDMETAKNAGVDRIAVTYGAHKTPDLQALDPLACIDDFALLPSLLI